MRRLTERAATHRITGDFRAAIAAEMITAESAGAPLAAFAFASNEP
jgi:hypothetical protein